MPGHALLVKVVVIRATLYPWYGYYAPVFYLLTGNDHGQYIWAVFFAGDLGKE